MTRVREPPPGPVVDCMERGCKCGKTRLDDSHRLLPFVSELILWLVITVGLTAVAGILVLLRRFAEPLASLGPGFHPHLPGFKHHFLAKALGATMWFFIFYRARCVTLAYIGIVSDDSCILHRQDGAKLLVRFDPLSCT